MKEKIETNEHLQGESEKKTPSFSGKEILDYSKSVIANLEARIKGRGKTEQTGSAEVAESEEAREEGLCEATLQKISERLGTNEGGWYQDTETGIKYYVKIYGNPDQSATEYITNKLYEKMGFPVPETSLLQMDGQLAVALEEIQQPQTVKPAELNADPDFKKGFVADALLANWDVVGLVHDNILKGADGQIYRVDNGGSLRYRAQGGIKQFGAEIPELNSLLDPSINRNTAEAFKELTQEDIVNQAKAVLDSLKNWDEVEALVRESGLSNADEMCAALKARCDTLRSLVESSTPEKKKNENLTAELEPISESTASFKFPEYEGRELKPGEAFQFGIPDKFKGRIVRDVILAHRKDPANLTVEKGGYDPHGAYSEVLLHDTDDDEWVGWKDPKGYDPIKFAEPRSAGDPENEVLHDWLATVGEIKPDMIRVTNMGKDELSASRIHGVEVVFFPELEGVTYSERVYTPGTTFIDLEKGKYEPTYGGGSKTEGVYKKAIALNGSGHALYELGKDPGKNAELSNGSLVVELQAGKTLAQVEVSVGDTEHLDHINSKTGRKTRLGYAKLWVGIQHSDGKTDWFMQNVNIPPQGVLAGAPSLEDAVVSPGDKLVIQSRADTAYVMGYRLAYK